VAVERARRLIGPHAVLEALEAEGVQLTRILVRAGRRDARTEAVRQRARARGIAVEEASRGDLEGLVGHAWHHGVVGLAAAGPAASAAAILDQAAGGPRPAFLLLLDGVQDPRNLGAILRSAEGAGVGGVFLPARRSAGITPTAERVAAGATSHVPVATVGNMATWIEAVKARGIWTVGASPGAPRAYDAADLRGPVALVLGGEGTGLRRLVRGRCHEVVSIPMAGRVGSLNVSVAAGILLFEVVRQRRTPGEARRGDLGTH
jgi:23S rRNA (guanosine2251-2'-O)-methyltransferase